MTSPLATIPADDNHVPANVNARLTALLENLVAQRGVHHADVAVTSGAGQQRWSAASDPAGADDQQLRPRYPVFIASVTKRLIHVSAAGARARRAKAGRADQQLSATGDDHWPPRPRRDRPDVCDHRAPPRKSHLRVARPLRKRRDGPSLNEHLAAGQDIAWTFEDMIRTTREHQRPHFKPQDLTTARQKARYSDTGFQLLIRIVETITDLSFYDVLRERIFRPLGLTCTWLPGQYPPDPATAAPSPLYARQRRVELTSMIESSNDLFSTTGDLLTFQRALLDGELFSDARSLEAY